MLSPSVPIARAVIVRTAPVACAHTPVEPALSSSAKHVATLCAVSPVRFTCEIIVGPSEISVILPNSGEPLNVTVAEAYCCAGRYNS